MRRSNQNKIIVLKLAKWLLINKGWVKNSTGAVDKDGNNVETLSCDAVAWSLSGAIAKAEQLHWCNSTYDSGAYDFVLNFVRYEYKVDWTCDFNDHKVVELQDVLILLDRCLGILEIV